MKRLLNSFSEKDKERNIIISKKGITLIALVITIIILIILAGITINLTIGEKGIFNKAKYAKEEYLNSQEKEKEEVNDLYSQMMIATNDSSKITISIEELNNLIDRRIEEKQNSGYSETVLFNGCTSSGTITFLDNHTVNEYDSIVIVYGENDNYRSMQSAEYKVTVWKEIIQNSTADLMISLYGYEQRRLDISEISETGLTIKNNLMYSIYKIIGINY